MYANFWKRTADLFISLCAVVILSPLLIVLSVIGAIAMRGNPFFVQQRPGLINKKTGREKIFKLIKFRTMTNEKGADGKLLPDEERLNKYGEFLRNSSLDELPSLLNILAGDMAIVGPRPLLVKYLPHYTDRERRRHTVRPGLTGFAQVNGRNTIPWEERFEMDVWYVDNLKLSTDLRIIFKTVKAVISHDGIILNAQQDFDEYRMAQKAPFSNQR